MDTMILCSCWKNDTFVRVMTANYLSKLRPDVAAHRQLAIAVLRELWEHYVNLAQKSTFRQFANSISHRQKHRLSLMFPVLDQFITEVAVLCADRYPIIFKKTEKYLIRFNS